jgi:hypothetical protein
MPGVGVSVIRPGMMWWGVGFEALLLGAVTWLVLARTDPATERVAPVSQTAAAVFE